MIKPYLHFTEVEKDIQLNTPPIIYKYRDWTDDYHKKIITDHEVWFAHPHTLNDKQDIRPPYNFIIGDIDWGKFEEKLYEAARAIEKDASEEQIKQAVVKRLENAKADTKGYFLRNRMEYISNPKNYDQIGVFSCCISGVNEAMWAYYGSNHSGFSIGFDTVEFARSLDCTIGIVDYDDTPIPYHVLGDNNELDERELFQKSKRWSVEEEFRFLTAGIGIYKNRATQYPVEIVKEILFGLGTKDEIIKEIIAAASKIFPNIQYFTVEVKQDSYGFEKVPYKS